MTVTGMPERALPMALAVHPLRSVRPREGNRPHPCAESRKGWGTQASKWVGEGVGDGDGGDVGYVAVGRVVLEAGGEGVGGDEAARVRGRQDGGGEDAGCVVDELGVSVGGEEGDAVREALFDFGFDGVVVGGAGVVAVDGDVLEAGVRLEGEGGGGEGGAGGAGEAGELRLRELVEVGVGDADVDDVRADIGDVKRERVGDGALDGAVPLLDVAGACVAVDGIDALAETGGAGEGGWGRQWDRREVGRRR